MVSLSSSPLDTRDRGEQILSAKKKLKNYRAKQALVTQKRSSGSFSNAKIAPIRPQSPVTPSMARSSEVLARPSSSGYAIAPSQDRTGLRSRHAHRHSRNASISVPTHGLLPQMSSSPAAQSMSPRPPSTMTASSSMGHLRTHSRSQSRTFPRSRPVSISLLGARQAKSVVIAIEHPAEPNSKGAWNLSPVPLLPTSYSADSVYRRSQQFLDSSALFGVAASTAKRTSVVSNKENVAPIQPMPLDFFSSPNTAPVTATTSAARQSRRLSRHARNTSISTKRESMEIMGGVGLGIADPAQATNSMEFGRRRSSRMSNLPSASVLFGANELAHKEPDNVQNWNWRAAMPSTPKHQDDEDSRLTALEKLEGRTMKAALVLFDDPSLKSMPRSSSNSSLKRASKRLSGHTRTESIQIPNLDEIHQNEISERRASWKHSPNPDTAISVEVSEPNSASSVRRESWKSGLLPSAGSSIVNSALSPALTYLASPALPSSIIVHAESPQPEGLGTLVEEEEEEESLTPLRERVSLEMPKSLAEEDERRQRREAEEEIVKRNRRSSLAPRPLKLKSRPPSLFLAPALRNGLPHSPSLPDLPLSPASGTDLSGETTPKLTSAAPPSTSEEDDQKVSSRSSTMPDLAAVANTQTTNDDSKNPSRDSEAETLASSQSDEERQRDAIQQGILEAHRMSVAAVSATSDADNIASGPAPSQRQGMRTLRLGSLASLASVMESGPSNNGPTSAPINKRRSLIVGSGPLSATPLSRDVEIASSSTAASTRAARRSSIMYKGTALSPVEHSSAPSVTESVAHLGSVSLAVHDELKTKANRDAVLLESTKKQVEVLERELSNESERSARERAELEQWSAEKEQHLYERVRNAELVANESTELTSALRAELATAREVVEDLQAEREVLQDDIDGWRSRCQDLEKTLKIEQTKAVEQRKLRAAARLRLRQLTDALERSNVAVPVDELGIYQALDQALMDAAPAHRSPALGPASPATNGTPTVSPVLGDAPSPQIAKLLTQMRQQIINLAGSLDYERNQHLKTKEEVTRLQDHTGDSADVSQISAAEYSGTIDDSLENGAAASPISSSTRPSSSIIGKNKRHIFAYDSSMGSFGQSQSSASLSMATDDTTHTDNESDGSDWAGHKMLASDSEMIGLGVGGLHTLDEIEEVSELSESLEGASTSSTIQTATKGLEASPAWVDIEAGPYRPSLDVSESSFGGHFEDAENAPPTPDLYRAEETFSSPLVMMDAFPSSVEPVGSGLSNKTSSSSSAESYAAPTTPPSISPRPEFIREWSFEIGVRRSAHKDQTAPADVEDFFGILCEDRLPALSSSDQALDLPPIAVRGNTAIVPTAKITKEGVPVTASGPSRIASLIGGRRPPVARSAYARESIDTPHRPTVSTTTVPILRQRTDSNASVSSTSSGFAGMGGRLSRMSLQNLTGAFSGLSGYLTNQSGAAVTAAAAATQMCNSQTTPGSFPGLHTDQLESGGWSSQQRTLDDEYYDEEAGAGAHRFSQPATSLYDRASKQISWSSARSSSPPSHSGSLPRHQAKASQPLRRAFVRKDAVTPPKPTPVWMLNFEKSTLNATGPLISL